MKKLIIILLTGLASSIATHALEKSARQRFSWGVDWSYSAVFFSGHHYNFYAPEGFRVDTRENGFGYMTNGEFHFHAGYDLNPFWNIAAYAGFAGASALHHIVPVSLRITRFFEHDETNDRWFTFIDAGSGICLKAPVQEIFTGRIGGGYRISLSERTKLDFVASVHAIYTHPEIYYFGERINMNRINRNNSYIGSVSLGIALWL